MWCACEGVSVGGREGGECMCVGEGDECGDVLVKEVSVRVCV